MNIFGLMFLFFVPGLVLGFMFFIAFSHESKRTEKRAARRPAQPRVKHTSKPASRKFYVWDMQRDCMYTADYEKLAA